MEAAAAPEGRPGGGIAVVCHHCEVVLAFRSEAGGEPDPAAALDPLLLDVIACAAALRCSAIDARAPAPSLERGFSVPGYPALRIGPTPDAPYWQGREDGSRSMQELIATQLAQTLEKAAGDAIPAPDRYIAHRFVRAAVLARLVRLRPAPVAAPGSSPGPAPCAERPLFVSEGH